MYEVLIFIAGMLMPLIMSIVEEACDWVCLKIREHRHD